MNINGIHVAYSPVCQRWFVLWHTAPLSNWATQAEAQAEADRLTEGDE